MTKKYKILLIVTTAIMLLPLLVGALLWDKLPDVLATHWGADNTANGWSSKPFAVIWMPLILIGLHLLAIWMTTMKFKNSASLTKPMGIVFWICPAVSLFSAVAVLGGGLGHTLDFNAVMPFFMGVLFIAIGNYLPKCAQNPVMGIKIPWTLNSEENWNHTHRFAGPLWVIGGALCIALGSLGFLLDMPETFVGVSMAILLVPLALVPVVYSIIYYYKHDRVK